MIINLFLSTSIIPS